MEEDLLGLLVAEAEQGLSPTPLLKTHTSKFDRSQAEEWLRATSNFLTKGGGMKAQFIIMVLQGAYSYFLRDLVISAIDNPDSEVDEAILGVLDNIFGFSE